MRDPDKPQQIIEAAVRVFARKGYFNSRVSDVAREAGIAAGTIYLYFKTKDDILITLFREKMAAFVTSMRRAIADEADAVAKVRRLVHLHFSMLEADPDLAGAIEARLVPYYAEMSPGRAAVMVDCPVFLAHGAFDDLIPADESRRLAARVGGRAHLLVTPFLTHTHPLERQLGRSEKLAAAGSMVSFFYALARAAR